MSLERSLRALLAGAVALASSLPPLAGAQTPLGTAFTYQGRLVDAGSPANGTYDVQLTLFDAASVGAQVGPTVTREDVVVANGLFTVGVDFGAVFGGSQRWIQLGVRPGASAGAFVPLAPRQELTPSPNAVWSASAPWAGISGKPAGFADGTDDDALGALACASGQIAKRSGSAWVCAPDADTPGWNLAGNAGTNPVTSFIGTTDDQPFEVRVGNARSLRIEPPATSGSYRAPNVLLGSAGNQVLPGVNGAVVEGGGFFAGNPEPNRATGYFGTVGGGSNNRAGDLDSDPTTGGWGTVGGGRANSAGGDSATVGGGGSNNASAQFATVGGGASNLASNNYAVVAGGGFNRATGSDAAIGGGTVNVASGRLATIAGGGENAAGEFATVPGGYGNKAGGDFSLAAGYRAMVRGPAESGTPMGDIGTFVWADSTAADFQSTGASQFLIRAAGGVGINTNAPSPGGLTVAAPGKVTFGAETRQMIDLWGPGNYGIGVQTSTTYFRSDFGFAWFQGGTHSNAPNDAGGGVRLMRLHDSGNLYVQGTINPGGADFAELLPAAVGLEPGDVLAIGADGQLVLSTTPYQTSLAGVYSTKPGLVGGAADGESTDGRIPLAVAGVVPVKVTDEGGPIAPGDALTSSSTPGHAMKAATVRVGGIAFFPSGVVIGKALRALADGSGVIDALVVLQ